jgi:3-oxoacyl-[acyl-carrier-protein] synthase-3
MKRCSSRWGSSRIGFTRNNIQKYGNTTAATIPIAYDECRRSGRIKRGDLLCFVGLGAGFHWGAALLRD